MPSGPAAPVVLTADFIVALRTAGVPQKVIAAAEKNHTGLSGYYRMMNDIDGIPNPKPDPRFTYKNLDFDEEAGKQGSACITFIDGKPKTLNCYVWDLNLDWMKLQVEKELGSKIKLSNASGGNGHLGWDLELIKEGEE